MKSNLQTLYTSYKEFIKPLFFFWILFIIIGYLITPLPKLTYNSTILIKTAKINGGEVIQKPDVIELISKVHTDENNRITAIAQSVDFEKTTSLLKLSNSGSDIKQTVSDLQQAALVVTNLLNEIIDEIHIRDVNQIDFLIAKLNSQNLTISQIDLSLRLLKEKNKYEYPLFNKYDIYESSLKTIELSTYKPYAFRLFFFSLVGLIFGYILIVIKKWLFLDI